MSNGMVYGVYVRETPDHAPVQCDWVGNHGYRCGKCRITIKVRSEDLHDAKCQGCDTPVVVRSSFQDPHRR